MNAQNLRQRWRKRVEKIGGNSGGREAINFDIPLRIFAAGITWSERLRERGTSMFFNHRAYDDGGRTFNRLKYAPVHSFFNYYLRVRGESSAVCAIPRFMVQRGVAIETILINDLYYELRKTRKK